MSVEDLPDTLPEDCVVVVGGGPVGLVLALILAHHGVRSVVFERSIEPTPFPKMDLTLARTMEIFRSIGIADAIRDVGVSSKENFIVRFSAGLGAKHTLSSWDMPSVDTYKNLIRSKNDGSMPLEPWQRIPGHTMEALLREKCEESPFVGTYYGWTVSRAAENEGGVELEVLPPGASSPKILHCSYAVGCDGASSVIRKSLGIELEGAAETRHILHAVLIHFKSRDLGKMYSQGPFWHTFFPASGENMRKNSLGGAVIAQDAKETWTVHEYSMSEGPEKENQSQLTDEAAKITIQRVLGGVGEPFLVDIDEILLKSTFRSTIALAKSWSGKFLRLFLAGDSCHQTVPSGGYGMNLGLADAWDLAWKLSAKIKGWGGDHLLSTYETERRPVAELMQDWGKIHGRKLMGLPMTVKIDTNIIDSNDEDGQKLRAQIHEYIQTNDDHNKSIGVELGYRYQSKLCIPGPIDEISEAPAFNNRAYIPTTFPGYRAPHVFLKDGSAIFDHFGTAFTLVTFADHEQSRVLPASFLFEGAAAKEKIPLLSLKLYGETHAALVWGAKIVLVRPDGHVSWRGNEVDDASIASRILLQATGHDV